MTSSRWDDFISPLLKCSTHLNATLHWGHPLNELSSPGIPLVTIAHCYWEIEHNERVCSDMPPDLCVLPSESQCDPECASQRSGLNRLDRRYSPSTFRCEFWKAGTFDWMTELFLGALQSPAVLLAVFLSFNPVEVDTAKTSCHVFSCVFGVWRYWHPLLASWMKWIDGTLVLVFVVVEECVWPLDRCRVALFVYFWRSCMT